MRDTRLSPEALAAQGAALMALLQGGRMELRGPGLLASVGPLRFAQPVSGLLVLEAPVEGDAAGSGDATEFQIVSAAGVAVLQGTVGTEDANLIVRSTRIDAGMIVRVDRFEHRISGESES